MAPGEENSKTIEWEGRIEENEIYISEIGYTAGFGAGDLVVDIQRSVVNLVGGEIILRSISGNAVFRVNRWWGLTYPPGADSGRGKTFIQEGSLALTPTGGNVIVVATELRMFELA